MVPINLLAVLIAAAAVFIIGFLAHGPVTGKLWMKLANIHPTGNEKMSDMYGQMFWNLVVNLVTAYAVAMVYAFIVASGLWGAASIFTGVHAALLVWLGFIVTSSSIEVIWMKRSIHLWLFECAASFVGFVAMGAIIASM